MAAWDALAALLPQAAGQTLLPAIAQVMAVQPAGAPQRQLAAAGWAWERALASGCASSTTLGNTSDTTSDTASGATSGT